MFLLRSYFNVLCRGYLDIVDLYFIFYIYQFGCYLVKEIVISTGLPGKIKATILSSYPRSEEPVCFCQYCTRSIY